MLKSTYPSQFYLWGSGDGPKPREIPLYGAFDKEDEKSQSRHEVHRTIFATVVKPPFSFVLRLRREGK